MSGGGQDAHLVGFLARVRDAIRAPGGSAGWFARLGYNTADHPLFDAADLDWRAVAMFREHVPRLSARLGGEPAQLEDPGWPPGRCWNGFRHGPSGWGRPPGRRS